MKKLLTATLAFIIFVTFTTYESLAAPSSRIIIRSEEELTKMREMAESDGAGITEYLVRTGYYHNGLRYRADVIAFLELVDSLQIPHGVGMNFTGLIYSPGSEINIFFESEADERHTFLFRLNAEREEGVVKRIFGEGIFLLYENKSEGVRVYSPPLSWGSFPDRNGGYRFPMEVNGFFIRGGYNPGNRSVTEVTPESIYGGMTVTTIRDLTWLDRNQPGDIYEEGFVTTANALEILRFVVGLENDIWGRTNAMAAADVNGDGVIDAADALEILRYVVGLPNAITGY
jgi:hypothetical protein